MDKFDGILIPDWRVNLNNTKKRCIHCEAISLSAELQSINIPENDFGESIDKLIDALVWILDNTEWPSDER